MRKLLGWAVAVVALAGCGGSGGSEPTGTAEVTGVVFDQFGEYVRDARVFVNEDGVTRESTTNTKGSFAITGVESRREGRDVQVRAEVLINGEAFAGQNLATVYDGESAKNVNIAVYPQDLLGSTSGRVYNRLGDALAGARVFARQRPSADGIPPTSAYGVNDGNGFYRISGLRADENYDMQANARGYATDFAYDVVLRPGEDLRQDFEVFPSTDPNLPAPTNLFATAWTAPLNASRNKDGAALMALAKRLARPNRPRPSGRIAVQSSQIDVELEWDREDLNQLLGFGVYRGTSAGNLASLDLVRDPMAQFYADSDVRLEVGRRYVYAITALNTDFADTGGQSPFSDTVVARPLGPLSLNSLAISGDPFRWSSAQGAEEYIVYVFADYPTVNDSLLWTSPAVTETQVTYDGPLLTPGRIYYYLVLGFAHGRESITVSPVGSFLG